jgi:tRNA dimethylallyltransferase
MIYFLTDDYVILVGSGLYVNAILKGFDDFPEINNTIQRPKYAI